MSHSVSLNNWRMGLMNHSQVKKSKFAPKTTGEITASACEIIDAQVPGNFELDLIRAGKLPENIFFGTNILEVQKYESTHLWYFTKFTLEDTEEDAFLHFEGVDTASEIFVDGKLLGTTENMLIPHEFSLDEIQPGEHDLVVHIIPASVYTRDIPRGSSDNAMAYNRDSIYIRKPPYMYGWDIMARCVSAGLWRDVTVLYKNPDRIKSCHLIAKNVSKERADLLLKLQISSDADDIRDFTVIIKGSCDDNQFESSFRIHSFHEDLDASVESPKLWWPKNYGEPSLYDVDIILLRNGEECDRVSMKYGIRTVELIRTSCAGEDGTFHFKVNGKKLFINGTNWVPTDTFPSRHDEYTLRGLELLNAINCNMVRCWGGNAYPGEIFYDYCDAHGILVWQDFSMACAIYPTDKRFCDLLRTEAESVVMRLRNRASLALWSGDNECDTCFGPSQIRQDGKIIRELDPNDNVLTRHILPEVVNRLDSTRPYLPSSPYLDQLIYPYYRKNNDPKFSPAEAHLWGPRDYFKGDYYYTNSVCHFASETGYHGCPSPSTLKQIIGEEHLPNFGDAALCDDPHWLVHAASPETSTKSPYAYRIPLMTRQVERLFGTAPKDIKTYALESQISQAEAKKFFVEHFRIGKWYRCGILWWNIIDGWPQVSDAVVDWYGTKKLAYHYLGSSQNPFCMMCDEPDENGNLTLCASNDTRDTVTVQYTVTEALSGKVVNQGSCTVPSDETIRIAKFPEEAGYYLISWNGDRQGQNHFTGRIGDGVKLDEYVEFMKKAGYYEKLEGF